jgi:tRNA threonylcarbamoyladenosine modification (KEOPS) complex Cgi121 subunit
LIFAGAPGIKLSSEDIGLLINKVLSDFNLKGAQFFNNRYIWGQKHISSAIWHSWNAFQNNRMISKSLSMEILLYTAGFRQIKKAINLLGVNDATTEIVGVLIDENETQTNAAYVEIHKQMNLNPNINLLMDYSSKRPYVIELLKNEGFSLPDFTTSEIEGAILQRIAILALE